MSAEKERRILESAEEVFLRYASAGTTMGDLAKAAGISRPALYLSYCNKEEVFCAVVETAGTRLVASIREQLESCQGGLQERLLVAFEAWSVDSFEKIRSTPDAKEIFECSHGFAREAMDAIYTDFERALVEVIDSVPEAKEAAKSLKINKTALARTLSMSIRGIKEFAKDLKELRSSLKHLAVMTALSLKS